jgi:hypothetical protein
MRIPVFFMTIFFLGCLLAGTEAALVPLSQSGAKLRAETVEKIKKEIFAYYSDQWTLWNTHDLDGFLKHSLWKSPDYIETQCGVETHGYDAVAEAYRKSYSDRVSMGHVDLVALEINVIQPDEVQAFIKVTFHLPNAEPCGFEGDEKLRKFPDGWKTVASDSTETVNKQIKNLEVNRGALKNGNDLASNESKLPPETVEIVKAEIKGFYAKSEELWNAHDLDGAIEHNLWESPDYVESDHGSIYRGYDAVISEYHEVYANRPERMGHITIEEVDIDVIRPDYVETYVKALVQTPGAKPQETNGFEKLRKFPNGWKTVMSEATDTLRAKLEKLENGQLSSTEKDSFSNEPQLIPETREAVKKEVQQFYDDQIKLWNTHDLGGYIKHTIWISPDYVENYDGIEHRGSDLAISSYRQHYANHPEQMGHIDLVTLDVDVVTPSNVKIYAKTFFRQPARASRVNDAFEKLVKFPDGWKIVESTDSGAAREQIAGVYTDMTQHWNQHDLPGYFKCYWNSDNFVYIEDGVLNKRWKDSLEIYRRAFPDSQKMGTLDLDLTDIALVSPDTASVFLRTTIHPSGRGVIPSDTFDTLKKFSDGWRIVSHQDVSVAP